MAKAMDTGAYTQIREVGSIDEARVLNKDANVVRRVAC